MVNIKKQPISGLFFIKYYRFTTLKVVSILLKWPLQNKIPAFKDAVFTSTTLPLWLALQFFRGISVIFQIAVQAGKSDVMVNAFCTGLGKKFTFIANLSSTEGLLYCNGPNHARVYIAMVWINPTWVKVLGEGSWSVRIPLSKVSWAPASLVTGEARYRPGPFNQNRQHQW